MVVAGLVGGGAALMFATAPVAANPSPSATINYTGDCGLGIGLFGKSQPDTDQPVSVPAGSSVVFVNKMKVKATLTVGSQTYKDIAAGDSKTVAMDQGTVHPTMKPECLASGGDGNYKAATITVTPAESSTTGGKTTSGGGSSTSGSTHRPSGDASGAAKHPTGGASSAQQVPGHQPNGGATPKVHDPVARGAVPSSAAEPGAGSGTSGGGGEVSGTSIAKAPASVAAQPVASVGPNSATSVLALIAAICLVGVGAAAVRTVLSQRRRGGVAHS
ncbi:hypothetical protein Athai_64240 [Actinocatenispora thailandica]|uniref:Uncharacterized protein n=2 Tax=Actinocatenispora thailandica TaxID=227318 RepID=A0A7R7DWF9_9ACTN|nr:hypothetical protein [Actinocatenispora thailandica]BCJ38921.1 hypothetical protein Athai_64240 [Actinocatenispora thailandica]